MSNLQMMHHPRYFWRRSYLAKASYIIYCGNFLSPSMCQWIVPGTWAEDKLNEKRPYQDHDFGIDDPNMNHPKWKEPLDLLA